VIRDLLARSKRKFAQIRPLVPPWVFVRPNVTTREPRKKIVVKFHVGECD